MIEFTKEWIEEQRKIIKDGTMTVAEMKENFQLNRLKRIAKQITCEANYPHALDHIERQAERIAELEEQQRWIPVSERLPEEDVDIAILKKNNSVVGGYYYNDSWFESSLDIRVEVTHWMPLPQPPKDGE